MAVRKIKIALIEDSITVRVFYKKILMSKGFQVIEAGTGHDGIEVVKNGQPDIIVLDMLLPDMHGLEVLAHIKKHEVWKNIPVMVLTSVKDMVLIQKALQAGANYFSVKGSDSPDKFLETIYKLLKRVQEVKNISQLNEKAPAKGDSESAEEEMDDIEFI